jgi:virginiamycin B lyase
LSRGFDSRFAAGLFAMALLAVLCLRPAGRAEAMLYWGGNNTIERMNLDGSYRSDVPDFSRFSTGGFVSSAGDVCGLAVDTMHVFWASRSSDAIGRADIDGTDANPAFITGADDPCGVAVDGSHVYWANLEGNSIGRANLDGTEVDQRFIESEHRPCGVAVNGTSIYWGRGGGESLGSADLDGKNVRQDFVPTTAGVCGVAVDSSHVYWSDFIGEIGRATLDGAESNPQFITGLDRPCGVAVDGGHVYWAEEGSTSPGLLATANLDGAGVNRNLLTGVGRPCGVAVDSLDYVPSPPPASTISLGRVRRNTSKGVAYLAVTVPDSGQFAVKTTKGLSWRFAKVGYGPALSGGGRRWLKLWPSPKGWDGHNLRRQLRNKGRVRVKVSITYTEAMKAATTKTKSLTLVQKPAAAQRR